MRQILDSLARHLEKKGRVDLSERFIDGAFGVAKRGIQRRKDRRARVRSSWLLLTLMVFHSPCTRLLLTLIASPLSKQPSMKSSWWDDPDDLLGPRRRS